MAEITEHYELQKGDKVRLKGSKRDKIATVQYIGVAIALIEWPSGSRQWRYTEQLEVIPPWE